MEDLYEKVYFNTDGSVVPGSGLCRRDKAVRRREQLYAAHLVGQHGPGRADGKGRRIVQRQKSRRNHRPGDHRLGRHAAGRPLELVFNPRIQGYKRPGAFLKPSMFFSITAKAENPDLAARFLNFFLNDAEANDIIRGERGVPVVAPIRDSLSGKVGASQKAAFAILSEAAAKGYVSTVDPPYPAKSWEVNALLRDITVQVLNKSVSSAEGASRFITKANQILAE
jgi:hypothetical protein